MTDKLTPNDIEMLLDLAKKEVPKGHYEIAVINASVDQDKILQKFRELMQHSCVVNSLFVRPNGKTLDLERLYLDVDPEELRPLVLAMGRANTWANRRNFKRSDGFFGPGYKGKDYELVPSHEKYEIVNDLIIPKEITLCLTPDGIRSNIEKQSDSLAQKTSMLVKSLEALIGKGPVSFPSCHDHLRGFVWINKKVGDSLDITAELYDDSSSSTGSPEEYILRDSRYGGVGKLTYSPVMSNGESADSDTLNKYLGHCLK